MLLALPERTHESAASQRLLEVLDRSGAINGAVAERARRAALKSGERIDVVLMRLGLIDERVMAAALAESLDLPLVVAAEMPSEPVLADVLPLGYLRERRVLPLAGRPDRLTLAMADPLDHATVAAIAFLVERPVERRVIAPADLGAAFDRIYIGSGQPADGLELGPTRAEDGAEDDVDRLRDLASEAPIIRLVQQLITRAVEERASDIHIEPSPEAVRVRFRLDGVLHVVETLPAGIRAAVASRLKIMARLNIAERRLPQDGRIQLSVQGREIDLRVSTMPTLHGESVVLRVLDRASMRLDLGGLGFSDTTLAAFRSALDEPNGIVLVTGPTGSGKTTTLYAGLSLLNSSEQKLFTVEDPIEYHLEGINQIQVNPRIGLGFSAALRSILRQDPDIVMIGEIRDLESAEIAVQASLTGHLVLSTVHTNSATATITRLIDMGIERYLLASSLSGVLAQRLVRRLCPLCAVPHEKADRSIDRLIADGHAGGRDEFRLSAEDLTPVRLMRPVGCGACRSTGFSGRTVIAEFLGMTAEIRDGIVRGIPEPEIEKAARSAGMIGMYRDGIVRALRGETTVEEVLQVTRVR